MKQKLQLLITVLCLVGGSLSSQTNQTVLAEQYLQRYNDLAQSEMQRTGVPAAITLAQGMLESGYGQSELAKKSNNHFGIKCKSEWTGERVYSDDDLKQECFRKYASVEESYRDHSNFLKTRSNYSPLFAIPPTDYSGWAVGLKKGGYATRKDYAEVLIKLINTYNLQQYTLLALQTPKPTAPTASPLPAADTGDIAIVMPTDQPNAAAYDHATPLADDKASSYNTSTLSRRSIKNDAASAGVQAPTPTTATWLLEESYPSSLFKINGSKVLVVDKGVALLAIASQYHIALYKLLEYNEKKASEDILENKQLVFLEQKDKKGAQPFHVVKAGERLIDISQKEGIQLAALVKYNKISSDAPLNEGSRVYLQAVATNSFAPMPANTTVIPITLN